jgi:hypothetical protein
LEIFFQRTGSVPVPDMNVITLTASGSPIGYQGYVGSNVLSIIKTSEARDPLDKKYYTYVTNAGYTKYQVLGLTENSNTFAFDNIRDNRNR